MTPALIVANAVFVTVGLIVGMVAWLVFEQTDPRRRRHLARVGRAAQASGVLVETAPLTTEQGELAEKIAKLRPRSPKDVTRLRRRFMRAGYTTDTPLAIYTLAEIVLPVALAILPWLVTRWGTGTFIESGFLAVLGYLTPSAILSRLVAKRQRAIENALPDALDLMIVCLGAGVGMDQAILLVSRELVLAHPALAEEFRLIITETRAGKSRIQAFRNFAERTGVEDVRALVAMLVQTDRFGTSVSDALRIHAVTARTKRRQRAEEAAAKIGVKLVFPLVFLLFPAFFVVTLGPTIIQFIHVWYGQIQPQ